MVSLKRWDDFERLLIELLKLNGFGYTKGLFSSSKNGRSFFILPLCKIDDLRGFRKDNDFSYPAIFLISGKHENPFKDNRCLNKDILTEYFGNPKFGNIKKAILFAEIDDTKQKNNRVLDVTLRSFWDNLLKVLNDNTIETFPGKYRESFYETFVDYYFPDDIDIRKDDAEIEILIPKTEVGTDKISYEKVKCNCKGLIERAESAYCSLNGIDYNDLRHRVKNEIFRAPIPFSLQELLDAKNEIENKLNLNKGDENKKINLLLIDNRSDNKFISQNGDSPNLNFKPESLCNLLFSENDGFGLGDIFEIQMIGKSVYKKKDEDNAPQFYQNDNDKKLSNYSGFKGKYEKFKFNNFKNSKPLEESENKYHKAFIDKQNKSGIKNYADLVYYKIKDAHFVLLDFFLDDDDTYLAFDFIRDMADIKKQKGDVSTTWYFITSAVYDSVVKYSQSGLLAEYYESAVVSAGDDPTNNKRQIIFLYKLLIFINARLKNFCNLQKIIYDRLLKEDANCEHWDKEEEKCVKDAAIKCLEKEMLGVIRRYLNEFNDVKDIFFSDETEIKKWQDILESLENVIKQFIWLPEADWYMIQHQIEFINSKLRSLQEKSLKKCKFSCNYILKELEDRSEVY